MKHGKNFFVGGIMNLTAGLGAAGYGAYQERQAKKKMAQADELAAGPIRSQAARQRIARQTSDAQAGVDAALRAQATAAQQLGEQGGSRALVSATPGLVRATELASQRAIASVPTADESVLTAGQNQQARLNLNRLYRAADAARQATIGGISTALMGAAEIAGGLRKKDKGTDDADESVVQDASVRDGLTSAFDMAMTNTRQGLVDFTKQTKADKSAGFSITPEKPKVVITEEDLDELSAITPMKEGGVQKTPGEFDHDDNPIDIVQEGAKIGEMTGGEYIFNPEQAEEMRKLSEEGDTELHEFVRNLLNKEQFK
jgi:hypothetical protein